MTRTQIFGDAARMGDDLAVSAELRKLDEVEAARLEAEREARREACEREKLAKRGKRGLKKIA